MEKEGESHMDEGWEKKALSPKGAADIVSRYGWILRYVPLLVVLSILSLYLRGGVVEMAFGGGSGTESDPYLIATEAHLRDMAAHPLPKDRKHFLQTTDIALSGEWSPIPEFSGRYNGNGHKITDLTIKNDRLTYVGLFGIIEHDGEIRDLTVETSSEGISNSIEDVRSGIIAGKNSGLIENCTTRGRVEDGVLAGGITAYNDGTVKNCVNHAVIASTDVCRYFSAGGIVGMNNDVLTGTTGLITGCTNYGSITAESKTSGIVSENVGTVEYCANHGSVSTKGGIFEIYAGGVAGSNNNDSLIVRCRNTGAVSASGQKRVFAGGIVGINIGRTIDSRSAVDASAQGEPSGHGVVVGRMYSGEIINCGELRQ